MLFQPFAACELDFHERNYSFLQSKQLLQFASLNFTTQIAAAFFAKCQKKNFRAPLHVREKLIISYQTFWKVGREFAGHTKLS